MACYAKIEIEVNTGERFVRWKVDSDEFQVDNVEACVEDIVHKILEPKLGTKSHPVTQSV